ncbi:MAG: hypothetical protein WA695_10550 [Candidatus Dormiibacterota bacterium]
MADHLLEDEIKAILASAHDKGAEATGGEAPVPDLDLNDPASSYILPALMTNERTWAFLIPIIHGLEEALVRLAREIDKQRDA